MSMHRRFDWRNNDTLPVCFEEVLFIPVGIELLHAFDDAVDGVLVRILRVLQTGVI